MKGKVSLYYNQITIGLQSGYNQFHHRLLLGSTQYKPFPKRKKKEDKGERHNERKEKERKEKERKEVERKEKERKEVEKRRREKGMERVYSEGKREGEQEVEEKMKMKKNEKEKRKKKKNKKWRRRFMKRTALSKKNSLARS